MIKLDRILVPTDFSDGSERALIYGVELAKRFAGELHVVHVAQHPAIGGLYAASFPQESLAPEEFGRQQLEALEVPEEDQVSRVQRRVLLGAPFVEIVRYARENDVDLIVIGTHGQTGIVHMLMGSVAEKVVRKAPCAVLAVRPEGHQFVMP